MATARQKPNGYWYVRYADVDGKMREEATGLWTKGKRPNDSVKSRVAEVIEREKNARLAKAEPSDKLDLKTVSEAWFIYETWLRGHRKEATWRNYTAAFNNYFIPYYANTYIDDLSEEKLDYFFLELLTIRDLSARHCNTLRIYFQGFMTWCQRRHYCLTNPAKDVEPLAEEDPDMSSLNLEHCVLILQELNGQDRAIWATLFLAGIRLGEAKGLKRGDLHSTDHKLIIERSVYKSGSHAMTKNKDKTPFQKVKSDASKRNIVIPKLLCDILSEWRRRSAGLVNPFDLMFTNPNTHGVFNEDMFRRRMQAAAKVAATKVKGYEPLLMSDAKCHKARSAFARIYLESGGNIEDLRRHLGHSRIQTTMRYLKWAPGFEKSAFDLITNDKLGLALGTDFGKVENDLLTGL